MDLPPDQPPPVTVCIALDHKFKRWSGDSIRGAGIASSARVIDGGKWAFSWTSGVYVMSAGRRVEVDFVLDKHLPIVMDTLEFCAYVQGRDAVTGTAMGWVKGRQFWTLRAEVITPADGVKPYAYTLAADYRLPFTQGEPRRLPLPYRNNPHPSFT